MNEQITLSDIVTSTGDLKLLWSFRCFKIHIYIVLTTLRRSSSYLQQLDVTKSFHVELGSNRSHLYKLKTSHFISTQSQA